MKKFLISLFVFLFITSCGKIIEDNQNVAIISGTGIIDENISEDLTGTGIVDKNINENLTGTIDENINNVDILDLDEKIKRLISQENVLSLLKESNNGDLFEEMPSLESYYTKNAFYEFYILNSIKNNDISECNKIEIDTEKKLCENIFNNKNNKNKVISLLNEFGNDEEFSLNMYDVIFNIINNNTECNNKNIVLYLACKKIFYKDYDVKKDFLYYSTLELSNQYLVTNYYKDFIGYWKLDNGFLYVVEQSLIQNLDK